MNILANIQDIVSKGLDGLGQQSGQGGLSGLLGPAALGGLAGALLTSKAARGVAGGALLAGGGAYLWNMYKDRFARQDGQPVFEAQAASPADQRAKRLVRALVFAAKSDGHIDRDEQKAIDARLAGLNIGPDAEQVVRQALEEPLDPNRIASEVLNQEEALEIYAVSCAVAGGEHFMERSYLDALSKALHIPDDVKADIEARLTSQQA